MTVSGLFPRRDGRVVVLPSCSASTTSPASLGPRCLLYWPNVDSGSAGGDIHLHQEAGHRSTLWAHSQAWVSVFISLTMSVYILPFFFPLIFWAVLWKSEEIRTRDRWIFVFVFLFFFLLFLCFFFFFSSAHVLSYHFPAWFMFSCSKTADSNADRFISLSSSSAQVC